MYQIALNFKEQSEKDLGSKKKDRDMGGLNFKPHDLDTNADEASAEAWDGSTHSERMYAAERGNVFS